MFSFIIQMNAAFNEEMDKNIYKGTKSGFDSSLYMTTVLMLYNRVDNLKISCDIDNYMPETFMDSGVYSFNWFTSPDMDPDKTFKTLGIDKQNIKKLPTHEKFLCDQLKQNIYIRIFPEKNSVCFFTTKITGPMWHAVQFFIPKYFDVFKEKPLTKDETSFLETLTYKVNGNYITKLSELVSTESFSKFSMKYQLAGFEKMLFEAKVTTAKSRLAELENEMENALSRYRRACEQRMEAAALVLGFETMADNTSEHTELQDYLMNSKAICNFKINGSTMSFIAKTYLAPHHMDDWEIITNRSRAFDGYATMNYRDPAEIKLLLDAILSERHCLRVKMCAYFQMDYFGSTATSQIGYDYKKANKSLEDYIPNPHLQHHNCFGQNKTAILEQLKTGDAIGAIECSIACAQRLNIHDISFGAFVRDLLNSKGKCIVADNGTEMTVKEAISWLKGKQDE